MNPGEPSPERFNSCSTLHTARTIRQQTSSPPFAPLNEHCSEPLLKFRHVVSAQPQNASR